MTVTISQHLLEAYGIEAVAGRKCRCPFCGGMNFSIKADDTVGKCFSPSCLKFIHVSHLESGYASSANSVLMNFVRISHDELLNHQDSDAFRYLTEERKIHPQVIADYVIGVVPDWIDLPQLFANAHSILKERRKRSSKPETIQEIDSQLDYLQKCQEKLVDEVLKYPGWICFFYTDSDLQLTQIRIRQPYEKIFRTAKFGKAPGLFGTSVFVNDKNLMVFEGEFDMLQYQSLRVRAVGEMADVYCNAVAVGGAASPDFEAIKKLNLRPIFCYDRDAAGKDMLKNAQDAMHFEAFTVPEPHKDMDEHIVSYGQDYVKAFEDCEKLLTERQPYWRYFASVARELDRARNLKGYIRDRIIADIVLRDFKARGTFYVDDIDGYYFFEEEKKLIKVEKSNPDLISLLSRYKFNASEKIFTYLMKELENECYTNGIRSTVHRFAYYNAKKNVLYVSNNGSQVYRVTTDGIETVDNGTDGVLFVVNPRSTVYQLVDFNPFESRLEDIVIKKINFAKSSLSTQELQYLFELWLLGLFFESIMPTKPIIAFIGQKGSGKSSTLRKVGILFFGESFDVTPLPSEVRDFDTIAVNSYLLALDNADSRYAWLEDRMAVLATGGSLKRRRLYSNDDLIEVKPHCFLGITSRNPYFRRDDIADRLLIMRVKRIHNYVGEHILLDEILKNRNAIMTELLYRLQQVLKALANEEVRYEGKIRMADFASFAFKVAVRDGRQDELNELLDKLATEQAIFNLERDELVFLIREWLDDKPLNADRFIQNSDLYSELKEMADRKHEPFPFKSRSSFIQIISNKRSNLRIFFDIEKQQIKKDTYGYRYRLREDSPVPASDDDEDEGYRTPNDDLFE